MEQQLASIQQELAAKETQLKEASAGESHQRGYAQQLFQELQELQLELDEAQQGLQEKTTQLNNLQAANMEADVLDPQAEELQTLAYVSSKPGELPADAAAAAAKRVAELLSHQISLFTHGQLSEHHGTMQQHSVDYASELRTLDPGSAVWLDGQVAMMMQAEEALKAQQKAGQLPGGGGAFQITQEQRQAASQSFEQSLAEAAGPTLQRVKPLEIPVGPGRAHDVTEGVFTKPKGAMSEEEQQQAARKYFTDWGGSGKIWVRDPKFARAFEMNPGVVYEEFEKRPGLKIQYPGKHEAVPFHAAQLEHFMQSGKLSKRLGRVREGAEPTVTEGKASDFVTGTLAGQFAYPPTEILDLLSDLPEAQTWVSKQYHASLGTTAEEVEANQWKKVAANKITANMVAGHLMERGPMMLDERELAYLNEDEELVGLLESATAIPGARKSLEQLQHQLGAVRTQAPGFTPTTVEQAIQQVNVRQPVKKGVVPVRFKDLTLAQQTSLAQLGAGGLMDTLSQIKAGQMSHGLPPDQLDVLKRLVS
jgi:hypothetical protein